MFLSILIIILIDLCNIADIKNFKIEVVADEEFMSYLCHNKVFI